MDAPLNSVPHAPLDYAPREPWIRRRAARRMTLVLAGVALLGAIWSVGPRLWRCTQLWYWQRQCLSYVADPDSEITNSATPLAWQRLDAGSLRGVGIAFMHEMKTPAGDRRLVVVEAYVINRTAVMPMARVFVPGNLLHPGRAILTQTTAPQIPASSKIFAGQIDKDDPSHFTLRYQASGGPMLTLDGWLKSDDSILLEERGHLETGLPTPSTTARSN